MIPSGSGDRPVVAIYRDFLLPFSETFIYAQATSLTRYRPVFIGRKRVAGIDLQNQDVEVLDRGGAAGVGRSLAYRTGYAPRAFLRRVRARAPVLLHAHFGPDAISAYPLQRKLGVPLMVTFHGYDATQTWTVASGPAGLRYRLRRQSLAQRADRIIAVSHFIRQRLLGLGMPPDRVVTHYIGVDTAQFAQSPLEGRGNLVLAVGRFVEKKGFVQLIDAMARVERERDDTLLLLAGTGPLEPQLRQQAQAKLRSYRFVGPVAPERVRSLMQEARVLAAPSVTAANGDSEGLPITVLEALASGLPVVGTAHAGIPEAVRDGENGFLVPERDPIALAERLLDALCDDDRWRSMSVNARELAEKQFDLRRQTAGLESLYAELTGS